MVAPLGGLREWGLRRECRKLLRDLDVPAPLDVGDLCRRLGEARKRPIELYEYPITVPGPMGLWFRLKDRDAIFYHQETVPWHQDHIILHELGHLLRGHPSDMKAADSAIIDICRNPPPEWGHAEVGNGHDGDVYRRRRTCYDDRFEREAELYATIIQEWASVLATESAPTGDAAERRISRSLSHHQGWR